MKNKDLLTVGQLAKKMNVTVRTLQYYDQEAILKPSTLSEGGRRLYSSKDIIKLHQILTLKYLGFSLEDIRNKIYDLSTPQEVVAVLESQQKTIEVQVSNLQEILSSLILLKEEVIKMESVNFDKYADIISLTRMGNENYWVINAFDDSLNNHLRERFASQPKLAEQVLKTYHILVDEGIELKRSGESPTSEKSKEFAKRWWEMINHFTGGDMSLLPKLHEFNFDKSNWKEDIALKQKEIDPFMEEVLRVYFKDLKMDV